MEGSVSVSNVNRRGTSKSSIQLFYLRAYDAHIKWKFVMDTVNNLNNFFFIFALYKISKHFF